MNYVTLTPAYGRDYKNKSEVKTAWESDKDFLIQSFGHPYDGKPMNKAQATAGTVYNIRYCRMTKVLPVKTS